ncbi:MAG: hypothetical protein P4L84_31725 [Isosphaeraceae bacterium]|nr:hypothetical protein [Isosphaeraceae bacterium]
MSAREIDTERAMPLVDDEAAPVPEEGAARRTMSPGEVLERLKRGEPVTNVRVVGLELKGQFDRPVVCKDVTLVQPQINRAAFAEIVEFGRCTIDRPRFNVSTFAKGLCLGGSTVSRAEFRRLTVAGPFDCNNARFRGKFVLENSRFDAKVRLWEAVFQGWVSVRQCEFLGEADLRSLHAEQGFVLTACAFRSSFLFRGATVEKKFEADKTRFEALTDFSKAKLHDFVYLESIEQGENQTFAFANALAERILVRPDQLEGHVASEKAGDYAQAMQEYGLLKRVFEGLHRYEQEDWAFYRFKVNQRRAKARSWTKPWTKVARFCDWLLLDHGCGYGTNPLRAVRAALLIVLAFGIVYGLGVHMLHVEHPPFHGDKESLANRVMIGALTSVSAFTSGFGDIRGAAHGWMNLPLIAESLLGTLLWGLFIVAFSRKVIR